MSARLLTRLRGILLGGAHLHARHHDAEPMASYHLLPSVHAICSSHLLLLLLLLVLVLVLAQPSLP